MDNGTDLWYAFSDVPVGVFENSNLEREKEMIHTRLVHEIDPVVIAFMVGKTITGFSTWGAGNQNVAIEAGNVRMRISHYKETDILSSFEAKVSCPMCSCSNWILIQSTGNIGADNSECMHTCKNCQRRFSTKGMVNEEVKQAYQCRISYKGDE